MQPSRDNPFGLQCRVQSICVVPCRCDDAVVPFRFLIVTTAFLSLLAAPALVRADLTTVAEVRSLTQEQARGQLPVRLRGVVTYFAAGTGHAFVQDDTGSIFFSPGVNGTPGSVVAEPGEVVDIAGLTVAGSFSPSVAGGTAADGTRLPVRLEKLGERRHPAAEEVDLREIRHTRWHDQYVRVHGTVRKVDGNEIWLSDRAGRLTSVVFHTESRVTAAWINREVALDAVVAGGTNERGQFGNVRLLVADASSAAPQPLAAADETRSIADLFLYQPQSSAYADAATRWALRGTVSLVRTGGFYLADEKSGLWVQTPQQIEVKVGGRVRVTGYATRGERGTFLADAIVQSEGPGTPPKPHWTTLDDASQPQAEASLAQLTGRVTGTAETGGGQLIYLTDESGKPFEAHSPVKLSAAATEALLRVTGISQPPAKDDEQPAPLALLLRSADDATLLQSPPWLSPERQRWLLTGCGVVLGLGLLWLVMLKRQVARQTRQLMDGVVQRTLLEERQRLGRDLHDSLEQQLAGLHLHLDALTDWTSDEPAVPARIRQSIIAARAMLAHCRTEARRSVHDLRSATLERGGLAGALGELTSSAPPAGVPALSLDVTGTATPLPQLFEFHLLRCAQECVGNALKHASATRIHIGLRYTSSEVVLAIEDDGCGFDSATIGSQPGQHFGLLHLHERATRLGGRLEIRTSPGAGATLVFTIPLPA